VPDGEGGDGGTLVRKENQGGCVGVGDGAEGGVEQRKAKQGVGRERRKRWKR
jgi:hypothetical protein